MFKNIIDSFLIIDAKDKPAPSFLTAYVFTWLVWHNETTLAFFKTKGDFTTRFNASLNITTENQWLIVLCLTFFVVLVRFVLNNSIYYAREFIDNKTQGRLKDKGHKSFISNEVYQKLSTKISSLQSDLLSSQDREKSAKATENEATAAMLDLTVEKDKHKGDYEQQRELYINSEQELEKSKARIADLEKLIDVKERDSTKVIDSSKKMQIENDTLVTHLHSIKDRLKIWSKNTGNSDLQLLGVMDNEITEAIKDKISKMVRSPVIYNDRGLDKLDSELNKINSSIIKGNALGKGLAEIETIKGVTSDIDLVTPRKGPDDTFYLAE